MSNWREHPLLCDIARREWFRAEADEVVNAVTLVLMAASSGTAGVAGRLGDDSLVADCANETLVEPSSARPGRSRPSADNRWPT